MMKVVAKEIRSSDSGAANEIKRQLEKQIEYERESMRDLHHHSVVCIREGFLILTMVFEE